MTRMLLFVAVFGLVVVCGCRKNEPDFSYRESARVNVHLPVPAEPVLEAEVPSRGVVRLESWGATLCQEAGWGGSGYVPVSFGFRLEVAASANHNPFEIEMDRLTVIDEQGGALWTFDPRYDLKDELVQIEWEELEPGIFQFAIYEGKIRQSVGGSVVAKGEAFDWLQNRKVAIVVRVYWGEEYVLLRSEYIDEFDTFG